MEAYADHDFTATEPDELSFKKGQILKVILIIFKCKIYIYTVMIVSSQKKQFNLNNHFMLRRKKHREALKTQYFVA